VQLSFGSVTDDGEIRCAYHGLCYDREGQCTAIPPDGPNARIPKTLRVRTYEVRERHGFVWLWWGDGAASGEPPYYRELEGEKTDGPLLEAIYPASFYRVMESNFDGYHIDYLHAKKAPKIGSLIHSFRCEVEGHTIRTFTELKKGPTEKPSLLVNAIQFPCLAMAEAWGGTARNLIACAPIDDHHTWFSLRFFGAPLRIPVLGNLLQRLMLAHAKYLLLPDDMALQQSQEPRTIGMGADNLVVSADRGIAEYWKILRRELGSETLIPVTRLARKVLTPEPTGEGRSLRSPSNMTEANAE
jgi:hypothetical protein